MRRACRVARGDGGVGLVEVLVTVVLLGGAIVLILGAWRTNIAGSRVNRNVSDAQSALVAAGQALIDKVPATLNCPTDYTGALRSALVANPNVLPAGWSPSTVSVAVVSCPDANGLQRLKISVTPPGSSTSEWAEVAKPNG